MSDNGIRWPIIESLILSSPEPLPIQKIGDVVNGTTPQEIEDVINRLNEKYENNDSSFRIRKIAGGYQFYITEYYARYVDELLTSRRNVRLTKAALETLAIVAYRQPVTKVNVEMIRGVASDSVLHTLLERKLVTLAGRAETLGRPLLYKTTDEFLKFFSLNSLDDLPKMEEIEELLASRDSDAQQSLPLGSYDSDLPAAASEKSVSVAVDETLGNVETVPLKEIDSGDTEVHIQTLEKTADSDDGCKEEVESVKEE